MPPQYAQNPQSYGYNTGVNQEKPRRNINAIIVLAVLVVIVAAVVIFIASRSFGGYEKPIKNFFKAIEDVDAKAFMSTLPKHELSEMEDRFAGSDSEYSSLEEYIEESLEYMHDRLEDEYGRNLEITYEIVDADELKKSELREYEEEIEEEFERGINVSKGYEVEVEFTIEGDDDKEKGIEETFYVVKAGGKWVFASGWDLL